MALFLTLAPIFATAGLTGQPMKAFYVGLAASLGAGISMGLAEALSDDGTVTGRGTPITRGAITAFFYCFRWDAAHFTFPDRQFANGFAPGLCSCGDRVAVNCFYKIPIYENSFNFYYLAGDCWRRDCFCDRYFFREDRGVKKFSD